ncbi:MAG: translation initiation factor IF-3 [bacterium]|nr:translation initiation factor IF-3 [bacterium]
MFNIKNEEIQANVVVVIDENGENIGKHDLQKAISLSKERGLDLVQVSDQKDNVICKIIDFNKEKYKNEKAKKNNTRGVKSKEIKINTKISFHDLDTKIKQINEFIKNGHNVQITINGNARENSHEIINMSDNIEKKLNAHDNVSKAALVGNTYRFTIRGIKN